MKIVWLAVNASYAHSSLAAAQLSAAAQGRIVADWELVQVTTGEDPGRVAARLAALEPDVCAATLYLFNRQAALAILARLKVLRESCRIAVGGPETSGSCEELLRHHPWLTAAVRGEGEIAFPAWLEQLERPARWPEVAGLCWVDADGRYRDRGMAEAPSLEQLPLPTSSPLYTFDRPFVQLETARGCLFRCAFCASGGSHGIRHRPLPQVKAELDLLEARGVREVRLLDRTFNASPARCIHLLQLFRQHPAMRFHLEIHPAMLPATVREELAAMPVGQLHFDVGLQSTSADVLAACTRGASPERALDGLHWLVRQPNLIVHADLIAGLPRQNWQQVIEDVQCLIRIGPAEIQLETLKLLPGTALRESAHGLGIRYAPLPPYEVLETPWMSSGDLQKALELSRLLDRFYNAPALQPLVQRLVRDDMTTLEKLRVFLVSKGGLDAPISLENRFRLLFDYLHEEDEEHRIDLCTAWICQGFSPDQCPFPAQRWKGALPRGRWQKGDASILERRSARIYYLPARYRPRWVVFDRGRALPGASAIYESP